MRLVVVDHRLGAAALVARVAEVSAWAGVCGRHEGEVAGERVDAVDAHDSHDALLEGLAERLQDVRRELGQLVEEEDALVRERDLARDDGPPSPDQACERHGVVRRPEGAYAGGDLLDALARHRVDEHGLLSLPLREGRKDGREPACEHGLAGARRPNHEQAVPSRRGDRKGALGRLLVDDVGEVERRRFLPAPSRPLRGRRERGEEPDATRELPDVVHAKHALLVALSQLGVGRADEPEAEGAREVSVRDHAANGVDAPVEPQLADEEAVLDVAG